jgi:hypothetical protein
MYSGWLLTNTSGALFGAHQKIDKLARRSLKHDANFPKLAQILHFEGINGPDGIIKKSPGKNQPSHFFDPSAHNHDNSEIIDFIKYHFTELTDALENGSNVESAYQAAWIAHALVDGMTPAHHYPYHQELEKLRGSGAETRDTIANKLIIKGDTKRQTVRKNWDYWGAKGLFTNHYMFEFGVSSAILFSKLKFPKIENLAQINNQTELIDFFNLQVSKINELALYDKFMLHGWTPKLARQSRNLLLPIIVYSVASIWQSALDNSQKAQK